MCTGQALGDNYRQRCCEKCTYIQWRREKFQQTICSVQCSSCDHINTDVHRAMVANAPAEKLLTVCLCPVWNWTQLHWQSTRHMVMLYDIKVLFVQKITFVLRKINDC